MNLHDLFDGSIGGAIVAVVWIIVHVVKSQKATK
jgi:hypothetical protein